MGKLRWYLCNELYSKISACFGKMPTSGISISSFFDSRIIRRNSKELYLVFSHLHTVTQLALRGQAIKTSSCRFLNESSCYLIKANPRAIIKTQL